MPFLASLALHNFRNLKQQKLSFNKGLNILYGENGSGKSSILEAIYLLSTGRSFRLHKLDEAIADGEGFFRILSELSSDKDPNKLDLHEATRKKGNQANFFFNKSGVSNSSQLAKIFPTTTIDNATFELLTGGPKLRRRFIDWGAFHIQHNFGQVIKQYNQSLLQRNQLLKESNKNGFKEQLDYWNQRLSEFGELVDEARKSYITQYIEVLNKLLSETTDIFDKVSIDYHSGWDSDKTTLLSALEESLFVDQRYNITHKGPHRSDLKINLGGKQVSSYYSRGQQKLFIYYLKLAQVLFYQNHTNSPCCVLIDDFAAEFDAPNQKVIIDLLSNIGSQCFITLIEEGDMLRNEKNYQGEKSLFHVKQGEVSLV